MRDCSVSFTVILMLRPFFSDLILIFYNSNRSNPHIRTEHLLQSQIFLINLASDLSFDLRSDLPLQILVDSLMRRKIKPVLVIRTLTVLLISQSDSSICTLASHKACLNLRLNCLHIHSFCYSRGVIRVGGSDLLVLGS